MLLSFDLEETHPELGVYCDILGLKFEENLTLVVFGFILIVHLENNKKILLSSWSEISCVCCRKKKVFAGYVFLKGIWWKNKNSIYM